MLWPHDTGQMVASAQSPMAEKATSISSSPASDYFLIVQQSQSSAEQTIPQDKKGKNKQTNKKLFLNICSVKLGTVAHTLTPAQRKQNQVDLCERVPGQPGAWGILFSGVTFVYAAFV